MYVKNDNILSFNSVKGKSLNIGDNSESKNKLMDKIGTIVKADIIEKNGNKTKIKIEDSLTFEANENQIKGEVGDSIFLEVSLDKDNKVNLKQIERNNDSFNKHMVKQADIDNIKELMKKSDFIEPEENILKPKSYIEKNKELDEKTRDAMRKIKNQLSYSSENVTRTAVLKLISSGVSVDKINLKMLNSVIKEIVDNPEKMALDEKMKSTENKITEQVTNKLEEIGSLSNGAIAALVKEDKPLTINNIYKAKYSAPEDIKNKSIDNNTFEKLMPEIEKVFATESIEFDDENLEIAKFMVSNEIPITKDNLDKIKFLKDFSDNIDTEVLIDLSIKNTIDGLNPMDTLVYGDKSNTIQLEKHYTELVKDLKNITPEHIDLFYKQSNRTLTLKELRDIVSEIKLDKIEKNNCISALGEDISLKIVTAKRQLEEIRLKLTTESIGKLVKSNIDIDTLPLKEAVEKLKEVEKLEYSKYLEAMDTPVSANNLDKISNLFDHLSNFTPTSYAVFSKVMAKEIDFNIANVSEINKAQMLEKYDNFISEPNRKYGDRFEKVLEQFEPLLKSLGIEANEQNILGAQILARNNMEVNQDNIDQVNLINNKINYIADNLNPYIATDIIKKGFDPSQINCDEVIEYIDQFKDKYGKTNKEKIAEYINEMDETGFITKEEKDSVMAIYKMLNHIQKDGNATVGLALNSFDNITLGGLLDLSKSYSKARSKKDLLDKSIDDNSEVAIAVDAENSIKQTLKRTVEQYYGEIVQVKNTDSNIIQFMTQHNIEFSLKNIGVIKELRKNSKYIEDSLNEIKDSSGVELDFSDYIQTTDLSLVKQGVSPSEIMDKINGLLSEDVVDNPTNLTKISELKSALPIINLGQSKNTQRFPIRFNNKFSEVEINVLNDDLANLDSTKLFLSLNAGSLGNVDIVIKTNNQEANLVVICEDNKSLNKLEENKEYLENLINEAGFSVNDIRFKIG